MNTSSTLQKKKDVRTSLFLKTQLHMDALMVVYQHPETKIWRSFAHPYGETTEATTKKEAIKQIKELTEAYGDTTYSYGNPAHLRHGHLTDAFDNEVFNHVYQDEHIMKIVHEKGSQNTATLYVKAYKH
ncbi:MAG: hypothetical protein H8D63_00150 [Parcubacteria group bacterium]|nr:hypothetical protein [Parcubacteria group bacterium]